MRICHWILLVYVVVSILALAAIPLSAAGWITPDPLSAIPALLLGVPWSYAFTSRSRIPVRSLEFRSLGARDGCQRISDLADWSHPE